MDILVESDSSDTSLDVAEIVDVIQPDTDHPVYDQKHVRDLVLAIREGEDNAWNDLVSTFQEMIFATARQCGVFHADLQDVLQNTMIRLFNKIDDIEQPERLAGWLKTTAKRESFLVVKKGKKHVPYGDFYSPIFTSVYDNLEDHDTRLIREELTTEAHGLWQQLTPKQQTLLSLLMTDPPTPYTEICKQLDLSIGAIGPTRVRAIRKLRKFVAENWTEADMLV